MREVVAAHVRPSTDQLMFSPGKYVGFAIGPRSLHHVARLRVGGAVHYLCVGQVLHLDVGDTTTVRVEPLLWDGLDYSATAGNHLAGWHFDDLGTRDLAPLRNVLECVPLHVLGYECHAELPSAPPRRAPYIHKTNYGANDNGSGDGDTWDDDTTVERYWLPFAGRRRMSLCFEVKAATDNASIDLLGLTLREGESGSTDTPVVVLESGIVVAAGTPVGRTLENDHFELVVVRGGCAVTESTTEVFLTAEARDEP